MQTPSNDENDTLENRVSKLNLRYDCLFTICQVTVKFNKRPNNSGSLGEKRRFGQNENDFPGLRTKGSGVNRCCVRLPPVGDSCELSYVH